MDNSTAGTLAPNQKALDQVQNDTQCVLRETDTTYSAILMNLKCRWVSSSA